MPAHDPSCARSTLTPLTPALAPGRARGSAPRGRVRRELRFWAYLGLSALCAILVPVVVVVAVHLTDDGFSRALIAWLIAMLMGLAVYAAAAVTQAVHRIR